VLLLFWLEEEQGVHTTHEDDQLIICCLAMMNTKQVHPDLNEEVPDQTSEVVQITQNAPDVIN
jgi:hypothetical protein